MSEQEMGRKVLVVDDEPEVEPMFRQRMRREIRAGLYEFLFAKSGVEALEVLDANPDVRLVITDINMPQMNGLVLLERLGRCGPACPPSSFPPTATRGTSPQPWTAAPTAS